MSHSRFPELPDMKNMTKDEQIALVDDHGVPPEIRQFMAMSPYADDALLAFLVKDSNPDVRAAVANRVEASATDRNHKLRKDRNPVVLQSVAANPVTAPYTLQDMENCGDFLTLCFIQRNPNCPDEVRARIQTFIPAY